MATSKDSIRNENIVKYLGDNLFAIPDYQRAYSWKTPDSDRNDSVRNRYQVKEFWEDIINGYKNDRNSGKYYYIGTIVLSDSVSNDLSNNGQRDNRDNVVDGQQRLVTLYLLYAALADWYRAKGEVGEELSKEAAKKVFYIPKGRWDVVKSQATKRLILPGDDGSHLESLLGSFLDGNVIDRDSLDSSSNVHRAFIFFRDEIQNFSENIGNSGDFSDGLDPIDRVAQLEEYIEGQLYVAVVKTEDEMRAHVVFETLNDRGIPLGAEDLIKNYLFSRAGNKYKEAVYKWKNIINHLIDIGDEKNEFVVEVSKFDKFIQRYLNSFEPPIKNNNAKSKTMVIESTIFVQFKQWFENKKYKNYSGYSNSDANEYTVDEVLDELLHAASIYTSLHSENYWKECVFKEDEPIGVYVPLIKLLKYINGMEKKNWYSPLYPLFFSALAQVEKKIKNSENRSEKQRRKIYRATIKDLREFIHYIESYIFRSYIIAGQAIRSDKFIYLARNIRNDKYGKLVDVFREDIFDNCFSEKSTEKFRTAFAEGLIENTGRGSEEQPYVQFAKYILRMIENNRQRDNVSEMRVVEYGQSSSLEHIFPYSYSQKGKKLDGWGEFYDIKKKKYISEYVFRIGNYALLHGDINREMPNGSWQEKRGYLQRSQISHTVEIAEKYDVWSPDVINEVQSNLANEAVKIWNSPRDEEVVPVDN